MIKIIDAFFKKEGWIRPLVYVLAGLFVALLIFQAGMFTGERRAAFTYGTGAAYYNVFERPDRGSGFHEGFSEAHGAAGQIVSISLPTFIVKSRDNTEKVVLIDSGTEIRRFHESATSTDLALNDFVVVIGEPNSKAQVAAKLIRILPPPPQLK